MICTWSSWCHCHPIISCFIEIQNGLTFLVPAYPGCPGNKRCLFFIVTRTVQFPIQVCFSTLSVYRPRPASHGHFRHRHPYGLNSSIEYYYEQVRTSNVDWSVWWTTSLTSLIVVCDCECLELNLSHKLNMQLATKSAGKLRPPVPTAGMATVFSLRLCASLRTFLMKWRRIWTTMLHSKNNEFH